MNPGDHVGTTTWSVLSGPVVGPCLRGVVPIESRSRMVSTRVASGVVDEQTQNEIPGKS